jgi:aryl sulfotransferase
LTSDELAHVVHETTFDQMKENFKPMDEMFKVAFKGGSDAFIYKGKNGRWREVLTEADLALYEAAKKRVLTPDCAEWIDTGWLGSGD